MAYNKESSSRVDQAKQVFKHFGATVKELCAVMGRFDTVFTVEAPDDETIVKAALAPGSRGNAKTETLRAFTEYEFQNMVATLP
ncbi:MAG: GYD domain-containing protein [Candidatus Methanosuratincola sp.]